MANIGRLDLRRLTVLGARARLAEIQAEEAALKKAFPELRKGGASQNAQPDASGSGKTPVRRRKNRMSAEGRKAVSERMKRYWAERRKAKPKSK